MLKSNEFSEEEIKSILQYATRLSQRGYITGMNLVVSDQPLLKNAILLHFLHDSRRQTEHILDRTGIAGKVDSRLAMYRVDPKYIEKKGFDSEYSNAQFYDEEFHPISIEEARRRRTGLTVANEELDLRIPLSANNLEATIRAIQEADNSGPQPWLDPVIIIRSETKLVPIQGFAQDLHLVSITKVKEEIYGVVPDKTRFYGLLKYFNILCSQRLCPHPLKEDSIVFTPSQVNEEFFNYFMNNLRRFDPL